MHWPDESTSRLAAAYNQGLSFEEIAKQLGRNENSCRSKIRWMKISGLLSERTYGAVPSSELESFQKSGETATIERLQGEVAQLKSGGDRLPVESRAIPQVETAEMWRQAEQENARRIEYAQEQNKFRVGFNQHKPIGVCFISDQHISLGNTVDLQRMREDAELVKNTPGLYACLGGDGVDNHIKIRAAMLAARSQPGDQWKMYEWYLQIFAEKIIAIVSGNHDAWTDQMAGIDMVRVLAEKNKLCYAPAEARVTVLVDEQEYRLAFRHQYRFNSAFNQGHTVKQWWRMGEDDFDIGCICHHHEAHIESFRAHGLKRWVCRPGSYQVSSGYSKQYGFSDAQPTCPTFILFPDNRRIIGFDDVRDAVLTLRAEREAA